MGAEVKGLHRDLARKFRLHGSRVEKIWRSLTQEQRKKAMRDGARDGIVLKDPLDTSMGNVCEIIPEWNLRDITSPTSDFLLEILKHRANTPLQDQYCSGINGGFRDHVRIVDTMRKTGLRLADASRYEDCFTVFFNEDKYDKSIECAPGKKDEVLAALMPAVQAQLIAPRLSAN